MEELVLIQYYQKDSQPMKSISALSYEEAEALAKKLITQSDCRAHRRFGEGFKEYYMERCKAESWLYQEFVALGGKPQTRYPLYFVLQPNAIRENFGEYLETKLLLKDIDEAEVSFTYGDSMANWYRKEPQKPILKSALLTCIQECGGVDAFLETVKTCGYLEAQLWTNRFTK